MTRDEALQIVRAITRSEFTEREIDDFVECLIQLGLLKIRTEADQLHDTLGRALAQFSGLDVDGKPVRFTFEHATVLLYGLDKLGYRITPK